MRHWIRSPHRSQPFSRLSRGRVAGIGVAALLSALPALYAVTGTQSQPAKAPATPEKAPPPAAAIQATPPQPAAKSGEAAQGAPQGAPLCDSACVLANMDRAIQACAPRIEAEAPNDFEWIRRPVGGIFQQAETPEAPTSSVVRYQGDSIRFLSPQREWARIIYECLWDAAAGKVVSVNVRLGILGKPNAVVTSPAAGARLPPAPPPPAPTAANPKPAPVPAPAAEATLNKKRVGEFSETEVFQVKPKPGSVR